GAAPQGVEGAVGGAAPQGVEGAVGGAAPQGAEGAVAGGACPARRVEISVCEPERRADGREVFTVYLVESRSGEGPPRSLWRRYSEFELLRHHLLASFPHVVVPPLPEKRAEFAWQKLSPDNMDPDFVERRRAGLEAFLLRVASHAELARDALFSSFLVQERGWREAVAAAGFRARADSRVAGALAAAPRLENPDRRFAELKAYAEELRAAIGAVLKARARAADRLYGVYKVHANYGRVFSEWSALERREMGDGLQSAGHHMDAHAASADDLLEEEEHYTERLEEYLRYADALRRVCREAELLRAGLETLARELALKKRRRDELASGAVARPFSLRGVADKLFGREAAEARRARAEQLGARVALDEAALAARDAEAAEFSRRAAGDVARFQRQKVRDVREALIGYAVTQIGVCKKGIGVWSNAKECFGKM
uniref:Sorting nexin-4 n=1 Tax=Petromyzon marinus TaxID=7757 RepID=A0AAJ7XBM9_PETMA